MTIFQIECFLQVAEQLSFARAAERMCMTQPAISYQVSTLEKELQSRLLERTTRSCRLTASGQAFYQDMKQMLVFYRQSVRRVQDIDALHQSRLSVGIRKLFDYRSMSRMVLKFRETYPDAVTHILPHSDAAPLDDLRSGRLDIGFVYSCEHTEVSDIAFVPLYPLHYYVVMNPESPLTEKESLTFSDLRGVPVVTGSAAGTFLSACAGSTLEALQNAGADLSCSVPSYESALILIQSNAAVCVLPMLEDAQIPGMIKRKIRDCDPVQMEICWLRGDRRLSVNSFVRIAEEQFSGCGILPD